MHLIKGWRAPKEAPSNWCIIQYHSSSCQMNSLKEVTVFLYRSQKGTEFITNILHQVSLHFWKSINWQIFTSKKETKLLIYDPIKLRNANSSDSRDDICMEAQNLCKVQLLLEASFASFIQLRERGKHSRQWIHIAQSHENKRAENPKASNFSTWDTVANTTVDKAHSSQQNNSADPPRRKELPVAHRIMGREVASPWLEREQLHVLKKKFCPSHGTQGPAQSKVTT